MKIFLINLDKDLDRLKFVDNQLSAHGVEYQRVSAVYGKSLSLEQKQASVRPFRCWCALGRQLRDGEIGCALSHYAIYQKMLDEKIEVSCILEDDVILEPKFKEQLNYAFENIDKSRPQVLLLSNHSCETSSTKEIRRSRYDMFAEGYVINRTAAMLLLNVNYPMIVPCDHWGRWVKFFGLDLFHVFPTVCSQNKQDFNSGTLSDDMLVVNELPFFRFCFHKCKRLIGTLIDFLFVIADRLGLKNKF